MTCGCVYYLLLRGRQGLSFLFGLTGIMLAITLLNPLLNTSGRHILFRLLGRPYTLEALCYGGILAVIFALTFVWFGCYSQVLTSDKFTALFGNLIPAISLLLVMVLRQIPAFTRKAKQISLARGAIGKGTGENQPFRQRLQSGVGILSALTDWALEGSIVTADSMRCRGYGCARRTNFSLYRMTGRDVLLLACIGGLSLVVMLAGGMEASYTPNLYISYISYGFAAYCLLLLIPPVMYLRERILWNRFKFET
ncbi:MAG: energy-coupling factor transporter transmembrane protein EcfT [Oscillospiraceae bacterium]|nr:energy-coupling factor transporter transmembrane protein EcfT [Oscillospiraceae bacterium]MDD6855229.1 energy-coupling factor transporter transmembrane component T [Oscillospiraceae bacterium]